MDELLRLGCDGLFEDGVAVAEGGDADAAEQVEEVVALLVGEEDAVAAGEKDRIAFVGLQEQLLFGGLQGFEFCHATITSVPSLTRVEIRLGSDAADPAGKMRTRLTPWVRASRQAWSLGSMPPVMTEVDSRPGISCNLSQRMTSPSAPLTPGTSVRKTKGVGVGGDGAGGGHLVGVDVVVFAVEAEGDGGDDGNSVHLPDSFKPFGVGGGDFADEAEVGGSLLLAGAEDMAVAAREAHGGDADLAERGDERLVDAAGEDHERGVAGFGVGDAEAGDELALLAHLGERPGKLDAAAMDDGDLVTILHEIVDSAAAEQEDGGIFECDAPKFDDEFQSRPSSSFQPQMMFIFWTAWPAAPLSRLSRQLTRTRRLPSGPSSKPMSQ